MASAAVDHPSPSSVSSTTTQPANNDTNTDKSTEAANIDTLISTHPLAQSLRRNPSFQEIRPTLAIPPLLRPSHLVAGTLSGTGRITVAPYMWFSRSSRRIVAMIHLGSAVCGHPGFIHGGLMAVLFDEVFARVACPCLPKGIAVTANLNVDFRSPGHPDRLYVLQARTVEVEGRKAWVEGSLEMLPEQQLKQEQKTDDSASSPPVLVAEAKALFIEPKFAESMPTLYKS
ncbi:hypothetical protein VTN77DRAFT_4633 [Rasamsonia byssochlamydoides]|uniref:uncharacterized protein n=1 Tax=Rasamsonia byssochlamydoides TaxID=89139 RepID=UPI003743E68F